MSCWTAAVWRLFFSFLSVPCHCSRGQLSAMNELFRFRAVLSSSTILLTWGILFGNKPFIIIHSKCRKWSRRIVGQEHGGGNPLRFLFLCLLGACALSCTTSPRPACVLNISKLFSELLTTIGDRLMTPNSPKLKITRDTRLLVCDSSRFQMLYPSGRI